LAPTRHSGSGNGLSRALANCYQMRRGKMIEPISGSW
jgi:hypothetical protein